MERILWVGLGGALGSIARYGLVTLAARRWGLGFPLGTLAVNVSGSLLLGLLMNLALASPLLSPNVRLGLAVGVLGGFTTFSSFSYETLRHLENGELLTAGLNVLLNVLLSLAACALGIAVGRALG